MHRHEGNEKLAESLLYTAIIDATIVAHAQRKPEIAFSIIAMGLPAFLRGWNGPIQCKFPSIGDQILAYIAIQGVQKPQKNTFQKLLNLVTLNLVTFRCHHNVLDAAEEWCTTAFFVVCNGIRSYYKANTFTATCFKSCRLILVLVPSNLTAVIHF